VWLGSRRKEGYLIVGIEQTSSSSSLSTYTFPQKPTVILLGKEKEGIPVQLLHMVDTCLEIPQLGIIRSLNVHVSGAIAIWEFTKQRLTTGISHTVPP
jgi:tRNA guanosine-2'-O-methyltransferase